MNVTRSVFRSIFLFFSLSLSFFFFFFCIWVSSCSSTICLKHYWVAFVPLSKVIWLNGCRSMSGVSILFYWSSCVFFVLCHTTYITADVLSKLKKFLFNPLSTRVFNREWLLDVVKCFLWLMWSYDCICLVYWSG